MSWGTLASWPQIQPVQATSTPAGPDGPPWGSKSAGVVTPKLPCQALGMPEAGGLEVSVPHTR
eukprot:6094665-Alexandrium_andersonii.AAC.1